MGVCFWIRDCVKNIDKFVVIVSYGVDDIVDECIVFVIEDRRSICVFDEVEVYGRCSSNNLYVICYCDLDGYEFCC